MRVLDRGRLLAVPAVSLIERPVCFYQLMVSSWVSISSLAA